MSDNKLLKGKQDDIRINLHESYELQYIKRKHGYTTGAVLVAMHVTKSIMRSKVIAWLDANWSRIMKSKTK